MGAADINVIAENLTHLLTNSVNMASVFYDLFVNPTPLDVQLVQLDANGNPVVDPNDSTKPYLTIPNRAKCFQRAKTGAVDPEGVIDGYLGDVYVNTTTSVCFIKARGDEYDANGWESISNEQGMQEYIEQYIAANAILTTEQLATYLEENDYTTASDVADIVAHSTGTKVVIDLGTKSGNVQLSDGNTYKVTTSGNLNLLLPSITDNSRTHTILVQLKKVQASHVISAGATNFYNRLGQNFTNAGIYDVLYEFDTNNGVWVCRAEEKGTSQGTVSEVISTLEEVKTISYNEETETLSFLNFSS